MFHERLIEGRRYPMGRIRTVLGDIPPEKLGLTLVHEHLLVDFIGADKHSRERYDPNEVFSIMLPYLKKIRQLGVTGFVECTPNHMARDVQVLARLSKVADTHVLTNTGLYKEPYLPRYAFTNSADQLAEEWINEIG
jgi:predicted metal-dependent phosphotriesterase family hydrolase